jgi:glycosyltransferase involved in cell wall biosynthesis
LDDALYEVIVVNDGSTDNSQEISNCCAYKYSNLRVFHQDNFGQSVARNFGLSVAVGQYILYVDSDDWIETNTLKTIVNLIDEHQADLLCFEYRNIDEQGVEILKRKWPFTGKSFEYSGFDFLTNVMSKRHLCGACFYVQKKELLDMHAMKFIDGIYYEDAEYFYRLVPLAKKIIYFDHPVYWYLQRQGSTVRNFKLLPQRIESCQKLVESLIAFSENQLFPARVLYWYRVAISDHATRMINFSIILNRKDLLDKSLRFINENRIIVYPRSLKYGGIRSVLWSFKWRSIYIFHIVKFRSKLFLREKCGTAKV